MSNTGLDWTVAYDSLGYQIKLSFSELSVHYLPGYSTPLIVLAYSCILLFAVLLYSKPPGPMIYSSCMH